MPLASGARLGPYVIVAPLGAGGMGEVYRAHDTRLQRDIALKALPAQVASDPTHLRRLQREAKAIASLNHPNIVTLHTFEEVDGVHFLTMELIDGQSLNHTLAPGGLPLSEILNLAQSLSDALVAAHQKGVVHRDLKPSNVMVTKDGLVKVLDFGLAKLSVANAAADPDATQATTFTSLTSPGQVMGTVPYMAPEQLRGETVDERTDIFTLGIVLYELATGRRPFTGKSPSDITSAILRDPPAPVTSVRAELPRDLSRVIDRCLEKDPDRRFQTAKDVRNEVRLLRRESGVAEASGARAPSLASALDPIPSDMPSIAVLPFVNRSPDEENEYFADGLSEELLNVLAKIRGLRVASRTSAFHFKGKDVDLPTVARKLNVATILEGSVRKVGKRVRITAQLIQVATDSHLWSETYDREVEDIFAVQDDIAQAVVRELRVALLGEKPGASANAAVLADVEAARRGRGQDPEAQRLYLQGRFFVNRYTATEVAKGIEYYKHALSLDPEYGLAWAGLSEAYASQGDRGQAPPAEAYDRARGAAERALQVEPELAEGHAALGMAQMHDWDWKKSTGSIRRALELAPGNVDVVTAAAELESVLGRQEEAITLGRRAVAQDPLSVLARKTLGRHCLYAGRLDDAEVEFRTILDISPSGGLAHHLLGLAHLLKGKPEKALAEMEQEPEEVFRLLGFALAHHGANRAPESNAALRQLIEKDSKTAACQIAHAYAYRGESDRAFEWLERAYVERDIGLAWSKAHPLLRNVHGDPRWLPFLEKMGLGETTMG